MLDDRCWMTKLNVNVEDWMRMSDDDVRCRMSDGNVRCQVKMWEIE